MENAKTKETTSDQISSRGGSKRTGFSSTSAEKIMPVPKQVSIYM